MKKALVMLLLALLPLRLRAQQVAVKPLDHYFYQGEVPQKGPELVVMRNAPSFDLHVHPAPVMGSPMEAPDFAKEIVLGMVMPTTDHPTDLRIVRVERKGDDLILYYRAKVQADVKESYSQTPLQLVRVPGTQWKQVTAQREDETPKRKPGKGKKKAGKGKVVRKG